MVTRTLVRKINGLVTWQMILVITLVGFGVYWSGLNNEFQGDDNLQIVSALPVHSISNVKLFFEGGTFYHGHGLTPMDGSYYRPLMATAFALVYTLFGPHPFFFHLLELSLCIGSTIFLFLFFKYSFQPILALCLALVFLVHPLDSQVVFAIPSMEDALSFFFGILALWSLLRFGSYKGIAIAVVSLLLSLLSKETGALFVILCVSYLAIWGRKRLYPSLGALALVLAIWLGLKTSAVGLFGVNPHNAPIDSLSLVGRFMNAPEVGLFFISKLLFPWRLASAYYWVHPHFSFRYFLVPLIIDLLVVYLIAFIAVQIYNKASRGQFFTYLFFLLWIVIGIVPHLGIVPLDFSVSEAWFYVPMAGLLGAIGTALTVFPPNPRVSRNTLVVLAALIIAVLGMRTMLRGFDWKTQNTIAQHDIVASPEDFGAYDSLAYSLIGNQTGYNLARQYTEKSISIYPTYSNYLNLGDILMAQHDYTGALAAYQQCAKRGGYNTVYEDLGALALVAASSPTVAKTYLVGSLQKFPQDNRLWMYLAIFYAREHDEANAKNAIATAAQYGQVPSNIYDSILNDQPFTVAYLGTIDIVVK